MFLIVLLYAILALTFTIAKFAVLHSNPLFFIGVRMIIAGSILLIFYFLKNLYQVRKIGEVKKSPDSALNKQKEIVSEKLKYKESFLKKLDKKIICLFCMATLFHIYIAFVFEFWSLQYISSIKVNIMYTISPFITFLISYFLYKQKITLMQLLASLIAFGGLIPLILKNESFCFNKFFVFSVPEIVLLIGIISAAYAWFLIKKLMDKGFSLLIINGVTMLSGGILILLTWFIFYHGINPIYSMRPFILSTLLLILLSNIIVYNLYGWLLNFYSINLLSVAGFLSPIFGAFYGVIFLNESLGWQYFLAIGCISLGLYLFYKNGIK